MNKCEMTSVQRLVLCGVTTSYCPSLSLISRSVTASKTGTLSRGGRLTTVNGANCMWKWWDVIAISVSRHSDNCVCMKHLRMSISRMGYCCQEYLIDM